MLDMSSPKFLTELHRYLHTKYPGTCTTVDCSVLLVSAKYWGQRNRNIHIQKLVKDGIFHRFCELSKKSLKFLEDIRQEESLHSGQRKAMGKGNPVLSWGQIRVEMSLLQERNILNLDLFS